MNILVTKNIKIDLAEEFIESVSEPASTLLYVTLGKNTPWANDSAPENANDSIFDQNALWNNMIGGKKITGNDVSLVAKRIDWTSNTVYTQYDDRANNLYNDNVNFYVLTDDYNVYKCLYNNNGAPSTIKPTYISFNTVSNESDGYIWKYMLTLGNRDRARYLTSEWMPLRKITVDDGSLQYQVQREAVEGSIDVILVSNTGQNYTNSSNILVTIRGDGVGATATASLNVTTNTISSISMTNRGQNYSYANVTITGGGGSGATARAIMPPFGGHGSYPVYELGASTILISVKIRPDEEGVFLPVNDFRQVGVIRNPYIYGTSNAFSNIAFSQALSLTLAGSGPDYQQDEIVYQGASPTTGTFSGRVLSSNAISGLLYLTEYTGTPTTTNLFGANSGALKFVVDVDTPELRKRSGQVIYMDNIEPITRSEDQIENIKIAIKF